MITWPITNEKHLRSVLGIDIKKLDKLKQDPFCYYYSFKKEEKKKDGTIKVRELTPSERLLKQVQSRIESRILSSIPLPNYIQGSRKKKSSLSNANAHKGKKYHFCIDIKNFFPSISAKRVNSTLLSLKFHPNISSILTKFMTYEGHVPQGAPTSSAIANLVLHQAVDIKLEEIIKKYGITYTRYIDDLNFSSQTDFESIIPEIVSVIVKSGFKINKSKTYYKQGTVEITGALVGNNVLKVTAKHKKKLADQSLKESSRIGLESYIKRLKTPIKNN